MARADETSGAAGRADHNILHAALNYGRLGWHVIPLFGLSPNGACHCNDGPNCKHPGKHPPLKEWQNKATTDESIITHWFGSQFRRANIGIATGRGSGIVVLDIDPRNGGSESLDNLQDELGKLPDTVTQLSGGGGEHRVFLYPNLCENERFSVKLAGDRTAFRWPTIRC